MKYLTEFRDPELAQRMVQKIRSSVTRRWKLMDVCGGQTHSLLRHGIEDALDDRVELIHGPGCPVCVTSVEAIDFAQSLAMRDGVTLTTFGDMLRVPGTRDTLLNTRTRGGSVQTVYSPIDAVQLAKQDPQTHYVFFAVGFETTVPATALAVLQADRLGLENFSLLVAHVRILPAMESIMRSPDHRVDAFLAAGHVCTITGFEDYDPFARRFQLPVVVTGFEPIDLLQGIGSAIEQLEAGHQGVVNCYARSVKREGNQPARKTIETVYEVADRSWRGFGLIPLGGLRLREMFRCFDAEHRFNAEPTSRLPVIDMAKCRSGDVLAGRIRPTECSEFGRRCCPDTPLGPPMVSSEGACAAYFRYRVSEPVEHS